MGWPRKKGARLPTLAAVLATLETVWQTTTVPNWYGRGPTQVELTSATAVWYHSGMSTVPLRWVLVRDTHGQFETKALLCPDRPHRTPSWPGSCAAGRSHLRGSPGAFGCRDATPLLLGLFSWVTLLAHQSQAEGRLPIRQAVWYAKFNPTISDAIALVRRCIWQHWGFCISLAEADMQKFPAFFLERLFEALCYST
jgi:hypothetical protein